ncbi:MAG: TauD/TfdA family dioxygenase, partial [Steroidobacteraceae bacterium]
MSAVPQVEFLPTRITLHPVAGRIGAEVRGVRLSSRLEEATFASLRAALHEHKVIFFRDQHLTDAEHEAFAARFGTPVAHPTIRPLVGTHYTLELD